jgi:hypothetical protein
MYLFSPVVLASCLVVLPVASPAVQLVSDQFNYTLGASAGGQNGGSGFSGAWGYSSQVSGSLSSAQIIAGLTFSDLPVSGNAARLRVVSSSSLGWGDTVYLKRAPSAVPGAGDEFWYRFLFHMDANITANGFYADMAIDDVETFGGYRKFGSYGLSGLGNGRGGVSVDSGVTSAAVGSPSLSDTGTYLMIAKFTGINQATNVARTGTWWALSTADYDAIKGGGITEAELNATHRQMATETVLPTALQPLNFTTADTYELRGYRPPISNAFQNYDFDEIFSGTSLADLGLPQVPEPTASAILLLSACIIARRKRSAIN